MHEWHQTVCQKRKRTGNSNTHSKNIQSEHKDGIWYRKVPCTRNEKQKTTHDGTIKARKNQNTWGKGKLQILRNTGSWHHQTSGDERKN